MVTQKEKNHSKKWADKIMKQFNIWTERLVDTPYISPVGIVNYKKPFDRVICLSAIAVEHKFCTGLTHNLKSWRDNPRTRHQYLNLKKFDESNSGIAILHCIWKRTGKRDLIHKFMYFSEMFVDKMKYEDMHDMSELEDRVRRFLDNKKGRGSWML